MCLVLVDIFVKVAKGMKRIRHSSFHVSKSEGSTNEHKFRDDNDLTPFHNTPNHIPTIVIESV